MKFFKNYKYEIKYFVKLMLVFFLFFFSSYLQIIPMILFKIRNTDGSMGVLLNSFSNILLLLILFLIYKEDLKKDWITFKKNLGFNIDTGIKGWLVGLFGMMFFNILLNVLFHGGGSNNEQAVQSMISKLPWLMLINAGIIGPLIEEIIFRKSFRDAFKSKWLFIIFAGVIFGLMHVVTSFTSFSNFLYFIPYSCLGIAFCYIYYETDTIYTSMFIHMLHNTTLVLLSILI